MHTYLHVVMIHQDVAMTMDVRMDIHSENPSRINHVNVYGKWMAFAEACEFDYDKMLRFKYMYTIEGDNGDEDSAPVFHVC